MLHLAQLRFCIVVLVMSFFLSGVRWAWSENINANQPWEIVESADGSFPAARHETAAVAIGDQFYLIGGRGLQPVDRYSSETNTWQTMGTPAEETHHFQPVVWQNKVYLMGGFYCCYPDEPSFSNIQIYLPDQDVWSEGPEIPVARRRGGAAAVLYNDKMYMLGGNQLGHNGGAVAWFDEFDPATETWQTLPDAPTPRDHFYAAMIGSKLIAVAGRQSAQPNPFLNTVAGVDIYDFATGLWETAAEPIPTQRAGAMVVTFGSEVIVIGGEIAESAIALGVVEAFDVDTGSWRSLQSLAQARHSGGAAIVGDYLHVATGGMNRGGGGETSLHERLLLNPIIPPPLDSDIDGLIDIDEASIYNTDPNDSDSDNDILEDGYEIKVGTDPRDVDSDDDTLTDGDEVTLHQTDPLLVDTDNDGLSDANEILVHLSNPLRVDSDADGLIDGDEVDLGLSPINADSDSDDLTDYLELSIVGTNPLLSDSDGDGISDGAEYSIYQTDPTLADTDADGLTDLEELNAGLNPLDADSNGDSGVDVTEPVTNPPTVTQDSGGGALGRLSLSLLIVFALCCARIRSTSQHQTI